MPDRTVFHRLIAVSFVGLLAAGCGNDDVAGPDTGSMTVSLEMWGSQPDPDGAVISIEGQGEHSLLHGDTITVNGLTAGVYEVTISGLTLNCTVDGDALRLVEVHGNDTTSVDFVIDCPGPGSIRVITRTTGSTTDPDGYVVVLDSSDSLAVEARGFVTFMGVTPGHRVLTFSGVAENCVVLGPNPVAVTVSEGVGSRYTLGIACPPFYDHIAFIRNFDLWVMESRGFNQVGLLSDAGRYLKYPSWSPDGRQIAFNASGPEVSGDDIHVLDVATMTTRQVTHDAQVGLSDWSPDGTRFVYDSFTGELKGDSWGDIYVSGADGSNPTNLTPGPTVGYDPAWSPDGAQIAFVRDTDEVRDVWTMEADGSNPTRLTDLKASFPTALYHQAYDPAWSPDGSKIAFSGPDDVASSNIWTVDTDGSNLTRLSAHGEAWASWRPSWSPDGSQIAYGVHAPGDGLCYQIYVMQADGSDPRNITNDPSCNESPAWSPSP